MTDATSQRVQFGSGSGLAAVECPGNVQPVSKRYRTIVADPPWDMPQSGRWTGKGGRWGAYNGAVTDLPYATMSLAEIRRLPVSDLADTAAHLYLWTTNRFLEDAFSVCRAWGFRPGQLLTWCKPPMGIGFGGAFTQTTEHVLFCRRGVLKAQTRVDSTWWEWSRGPHSAKPDAFLDTVEQVSPGPYLELFARRQRLGWDTWGNEAFGHVDLDGQSQDTDPLQTRSGSQSA